MKDHYSFTTEYGSADEFFQAVLSLDKARVERLKEKGVTLTENVKHTLVNGGGSMMSNKPAAPFWYSYLSDLESVGKENFVYISRTFFEAIGAPLYYSDSLVQVIAKYFYNTAVFMCLMECYDLKKLSKKKTLEELVRKNRVDLLEACVKCGWLKQAKKRDELIEYANAQNKPECTAYLLEFKNNTADLKAERAKAEKKAEREINAAPDSALELGKLWSWKKGEDGGLVITSYKGEETEVTIPAKIGNNIVTAVGEYALSYGASRANNKVSRLMIERIIVPSGIKTLGKEALGGAGAWGKDPRLKEVVLPETLDIFTDRQAADTAPNFITVYAASAAVIPRMENAVYYCVKNCIKYRFDGEEEIHIPYKEVISSDALFAAILAGDKEKTAELKKSGAVLTDYIKDCLLHEMSYGNVLYDVQKEFFDSVLKTEPENMEFILSSLKAETGEPLYCSRYKYSRSMPPELFDLTLQYFNTKFLDRIGEMRQFILDGKTEFLAICAKHGWLKNSATRDKLIQYASENGKTECTAWLLEYKNRTTDPEAEKKRAEKKLERDLNADPFSPKEMRKLWKFAKLEDGTLEITCYKGEAADVVVPERIGEDIVTAIGKGAFTGYYSYSPNKSKDREFCERHIKIVSVTLPDTVKSIGAFAFGFCNSLREVVIPGSVRLIGANAFIDGMGRINPNITLTVEKDSFAEHFCKKYNIKFKYKDEV